MAGIGINIIFFIKAVLFAVVAVVLIPKEQFKRYLVYSLFLGAGIDIIVVFTCTRLGILRYLNMGAFSVFGLLPFWTPIAWMFTLMIFFYFLPRKSIFLYGYVFIFSVYGIFLGKMLSNFGLYRYDPLILFFVFLAWFSFAAWFFLRYEKVTLE